MSYRSIPILSFLICCVPAIALASMNQPLNSIAASVNDEPITAQEIERRLGQIEQQGVALPSRDILKEQVLSHLITQSVLMQKAQQVGISISPAQLKLATDELLREQEKTEAEFKAFLETKGMVWSEFSGQIEEELLLSRLYQQEVLPKITVSEKEIDHFLASPDGQRQAGIEVHLRHALFALPKDPSPDALDAGMTSAKTFIQSFEQGEDFASLVQTLSDAHDALQGGDLGWRSGAEVPSVFATAVPALSEGQIAGPFRNSSGYHVVYLEKRRQSLHDASKRHLRQILIKADALYPDNAIEDQLTIYRTQLIDGQNDFESLAKRHSEDLTTAYAGGDMGWVDSSMLPQELTPLLASLAPGEVSLPIKSDFGWHLVQRVSESDSLDTAQLRAQIRQHLRQQKYEDKLNDYQQRLIAEAVISRNDAV